MTRVILISIFTSLLISCGQTESPNSFTDMVKDVRREAKIDAKKFNEETLKWNNLIQELYKLSDNNPKQAIDSIDRILSAKTIDTDKQSELISIQGDILFSDGNFKAALDKYNSAMLTSNRESPGLMGKKACCYQRQGKFNDALNELTKAADINFDFEEQIGNLYETVSKKDSAIRHYSELYQHDTLIYKSCGDRISELKKPKPTFIRELIMDNPRERKYILLN
jgi:tetratricopeptide (TPR) repeat protein